MAYLLDRSLPVVLVAFSNSVFSVLFGRLPHLLHGLFTRCFCLRRAWVLHSSGTVDTARSFLLLCFVFGQPPLATLLSGILARLFRVR